MRAPDVSLGMRAVLALLLSLLPAMAMGAAPSSAAPPTIQQLEATLLLTVAKFVEWPAAAFPSPAAPVVIGVVADEAVFVAIGSTSHGRQVNGRPVVARRLQWDSDMTGVHLLYVGQSEARRLNALLEPIREKHIVTVSRLAEFDRAGGTLTLRADEGRLSFSANTGAAQRSGVRLSSFLLAHATSVSDDPRPKVRQ
jgi:hypothetical protein